MKYLSRLRSKKTNPIQTQSCQACVVCEGVAGLIKPNFRNAIMNVSSLITKDYRKKDDFAVRKNKPNSNPIFLRTKTNATLFAAKNYENETAFRPQKNKPKQSQFHLPQRHALSRAEGGKTEVRCRMSEFRYLSSALCGQPFISFNNGLQNRKYRRYTVRQAESITCCQCPSQRYRPAGCNNNY